MGYFGFSLEPILLRDRTRIVLSSVSLPLVPLFLLLVSFRCIGFTSFLTSLENVRVRDFPAVSQRSQPQKNLADTYPFYDPCPCRAPVECLQHHHPQYPLLLALHRALVT